MFYDLIITVDLTENPTDTGVSELTVETDILSSLVESEAHKEWRLKREDFIAQHLHGQEPNPAALVIMEAAIGKEPEFEEVTHD